MAKALGLILVFSCGVLLGWGKAHALAREAKELSRWKEFLRQFRIQLGTTRGSPGEIVRRLAGHSAFLDSPGIQRLAEALCGTNSFALGVQKLSAKQKTPGPAEEILLSLGDSVGVRPLEEQLSDLAAAERLLGEQVQKAQEKSRQYGGLWMRLGVLLGLMAAVVLA